MYAEESGHREQVMGRLLLVVACVLAFDFVAGPGPVVAQPPVDSLGDPLPAGARLRLGTLRFRPPSSVIELALSPDEKTVVTAGRDLIAWDATTGKELWRANPREFGTHLQNASYGVRAVAFAPESTRFFTPGKAERGRDLGYLDAAPTQLLTVKSPQQEFQSDGTRCARGRRRAGRQAAGSGPGQRGGRLRS